MSKKESVNKLLEEADKLLEDWKNGKCSWVGYMNARHEYLKEAGLLRELPKDWGK